jgi:hypothetical protein
MKKTCNKCNIEKDITEFHANKSAKDGRHGQCIICHRKLNLSIYKRNMQNPEYREQEKIRQSKKNLKTRLGNIDSLRKRRLKMIHEIELIDLLIKQYNERSTN